MSQMTIGTATTANAVRFASSDTMPVRLLNSKSDGDAAEAAVPVLIIENRRVEFAAIEIRPEHARDVNLGVRELPEEKIRNPLLAGRANQKIRIGAIGRKELARNCRLIDLF